MILVDVRNVAVQSWDRFFKSLVLGDVLIHHAATGITNMSDLDNILNEDKDWRKEFDSMKVTGKCDSGCGKDAKHWFGNTSAATCGDEVCYNKQQEEYNAHSASYDDNEDND